MGTMIENLEAVVQAVQDPSKVGLIFGLAETEWQTDEQRDSFLAALTARDGR